MTAYTEFLDGILYAHAERIARDNIDKIMSAPI